MKGRKTRLERELEGILSNDKNETKDRLYAAELLIRMREAGSNGSGKHAQSKRKPASKSQDLRQLLDRGRAQSEQTA
jgi:hypothetical protein